MTAIGAITRLPELRGSSPIQRGGIRHVSLPWRHNDHDSVSNHQPHGCLLNRLFRRRSKKTSKLRVTGLCVGNSPGPVNSPYKGPVTRKMFPFDDAIMYFQGGMIFPTKKSQKCINILGYCVLPGQATTSIPLSFHGMARQWCPRWSYIFTWFSKESTFLWQCW